MSPSDLPFSCRISSPAELAFARPSGASEFAKLPHGTIGLRNSRFPHGPVLIHTADEIAELIAEIKAGQLDRLIH
ncbi:DUF397 domain-containing protein [Nonomuraea basaltis]|uniref:DUF397 domain-containing protein n=1 Tax=Nonomuraea basaltis TaxID=2495887 RepID=UPI0014867A3C|nr:DUF397 domain-containing protein [Nonomuraea basaltis]